MRTDTFLKVRVGLPQRGGALVAAARTKGLPALVSANAFARYDKDGRFRGFALPKAGAFEGLDVALDSAGFTAMAHYGAYPWGVNAYLNLAASADWAFYSPLDLCVEPELAGDRLTRRLRIAGTANAYGECVRLARLRGMREPIPILQGQCPADYVACAEMMPISAWPDLIGIGSMCRRNVGGEDGVERVIEALDPVLPSNVRMHLFGVKSAALARLATHPRVHSVDSAAWDYSARRKRPTGRTQAFRAQEMEAWHARQQQLLRGAAPFQASLFGHLAPVTSHADDALIDEWAWLVASGEIDYHTALGHAARELVWARAVDDEGESVTLDPGGDDP